MCARFSSVAKPVPAHLTAFYDNEQNSMLEREPPVHTRLRAQVMREFTGRKVVALEAGMGDVAGDGDCADVGGAR